MKTRPFPSQNTQGACATQLSYLAPKIRRAALVHPPTSRHSLAAVLAHSKLSWQETQNRGELGRQETGWARGSRAVMKTCTAMADGWLERRL